MSAAQVTESAMITIPIEKSTSTGDAARFFLGSVRLWVEVSVEKYAHRVVVDSPDQGSFMAGWEPFLRLKPDRRVWEFLTRQRDRMAAHFIESEEWQHGYWCTRDIQSGTEHFLVFLGMLSRLNPSALQTRDQILDAAEHLGNWVAGVPEWFDWRRGLFCSSQLGTHAVGSGAGEKMNVPAHLRLATLALLAYRVSQQQRYLDLAVACGQRWSEAIVKGAVLPLALVPVGERACLPLYSLEGRFEMAYRAACGEAVEDWSLAAARAESFLAADGTNTFLRLWRYTGDEAFRAAAEKVLDALTLTLVDPDSGAAADAIRSYWRTTGSSRYTSAILETARAYRPGEIRELALQEAEPRLKVRPAGVGKSREPLVWLENGAPRRISPVLLAVAAEMAEDAELARQALDLGHTYFKLARQVLIDGHNHGSAARTVSAVAGGNARENQVGVVTGVLKPLIETFVAAPERLLVRF